MTTQPAELVLIRHAHIRDNDANGHAHLIGRSDVSLSDRGRAQAASLAVVLSAGERPAAIYTSPLKRARETAAPLAMPTGLRAISLAELAEIDCGTVDGALIAEVRLRHPAIWAANEAQCDPHFRWPGGESYAELRERVVQVLNRLAERHQGGTLWLVTHAGVISQAIGALRGTNAARWDAFRPGNASVTRLGWSPRGPRELLSFDERVLPLGQSSASVARRMILSQSREAC